VERAAACARFIEPIQRGPRAEAGFAHTTQVCRTARSPRSSRRLLDVRDPGFTSSEFPSRAARIREARLRAVPSSTTPTCCTPSSPARREGQCTTASSRLGPSPSSPVPEGTRRRERRALRLACALLRAQGGHKKALRPVPRSTRGAEEIRRSRPKSTSASPVHQLEAGDCVEGRASSSARAVDGGKDYSRRPARLASLRSAAPCEKYEHAVQSYQAVPRRRSKGTKSELRDVRPSPARLRAPS
jgi:hypothetical protein